jgi:DNA-binding NarL/FixJ family response regulator
VLRVLIVDDHEVLRDGVKRVLDRRPGELTFGEAGTAAEALRLAREREGSVAKIDLR